MIGHLYRYRHPYDLTRFIYCGQGVNRDTRHFLGKSSFGRRFRQNFPNAELSQPIREKFEVIDQDHLNVLETVWMFQYKTWHDFPDGMNLTFPGSQDYKKFATLGGLATAASGKLAYAATKEGSIKGGQKQGRKNVDNGHLAKIREKITAEDRRKWGLKTASIPGHMRAMSQKQSVEDKAKGGRISGRHNAENGHLDRIRNLPQAKEARSKNIRILLCLRWNINRGKHCICGNHGE